MKISKSKKELARIISENGGWRGGCDFSVQDKDSWVCFYNGKPTRCGNSWEDKGECQYMFGFSTSNTLTNWHQTILSRAEYFHLYPEHTETEYKDGVKPTDPAKVAGQSKPTIEQLAADYRNRKYYADRKQQEADAAKADAEAKLEELIAAGKELGLVPVSAVKAAIDGCMQLVDMVPTRLQSHQEESVAAIGYVVNVERLYDKVRDAFDLLK